MKSEDANQAMGMRDQQIPTVSVVIPAYNAERYLRQTIQSVLDQSWHDLEIVVVNDGSTDGTSQLLSTLGTEDSRIVRIDQPNSGKPSIARNRGIRASRGEFLAFLDADDIWLPEKLERTLEVLRSTGANVCYHDFHRLLADGSITPQSYWTETGFLPSAMQHLHKHDANTYIARASFFAFAAVSTPAVQTSGLTVRRSALLRETTWFPEDMKFGEDIDLFYRLFWRNPPALVSESLSRYRQHESSITSSSEKGMIWGIIENRSRLLERHRAEMDPIDVRSIERKITRLMRGLGYLHRTQGDHESAQRLYWMSFRRIPEFRSVLAMLSLKAQQAKELLSSLRSS